LAAAAIATLKERGGSSLPAIKKAIAASGATVNNKMLNRALRNAKKFSKLKGSFKVVPAAGRRPPQGATRAAQGSPRLDAEGAEPQPAKRARVGDGPGRLAAGRSQAPWPDRAARSGEEAAGPPSRRTNNCEDCEKKAASFGLPDEGKKRWCSSCAKAHAGAVSSQFLAKPKVAAGPAGAGNGVACRFACEGCTAVLKNKNCEASHIGKYCRFRTTAMRDSTGWEGWLAKLVTYKEKHGDCNVLARWAEDPRLGRWVCMQRAYKRVLDRGDLSPGITAVRVAQLDKLGFSWELSAAETSRQLSKRNASGKRNAGWEACLAKLKDYQRRHGDCNVPVAWAEDPQLGGWVGCQRISKRALDRGQPSGMTAARAAGLEALGFVWSLRGDREEGWEAHLAELKVYKRRHGDCNVPQGYPGLGNWLDKQRQKKKRLDRGEVHPEMTAARVAKLDALGLAWSLRAHRPWAIVSKQCEDCQLKAPSFALLAEGKARWCPGCAKAHVGAVDVSNKKTLRARSMQTSTQSLKPVRSEVQQTSKFLPRAGPLSAPAAAPVASGQDCQLPQAVGNSSMADGLAADSDLKTDLKAELLKAAGAGKVGSQINNHLGQLASATLDVHPEIAATLEEHGFKQGQYADQFGSQLTAEDMSTLASKLLPEDHVACNQPRRSVPPGRPGLRARTAS
jgi:hypothetical protein